MKTQQWQNILL